MANLYLILVAVTAILAAHATSHASVTDNRRKGWVQMEEANMKFKSHLRQGQRASKDALHTVVFARKQKNMDLLKDTLLHVSDPRSSSYGQHMTRHEVAALSAFPEAEAAIQKFLKSQQEIEVTRVTRFGDYIFAKAPISVWESIFQTEFFEFQDLSKQKATAASARAETVTDDTAVIVLRALQYSLPEELVPYVDAVFNTVQLPVANRVNHPNVERITRDDSRYGVLKSKLERRNNLRATASPSSSSLVDSPMEDAIDSSTLRGTATEQQHQYQQVPSEDADVQLESSHLKQHSPKVIGASKRSRTLGVANFMHPMDVIIDGYVTPDLIDEVYDIYDNTGSTSTSQAIYASLGQTVSPSDLEEFQEYMDVPEEKIAYYYGGYVSDNACIPDNDDCIEANLDVQYIMSTAQNVPTTWYYWGGSDPWLDWITEVADMEDPPIVWSISYASYEAAFSSSYLDSFSNEAIKLANAGVTIMTASGDDGVAGFLVADGDIPCGYYVMFPASCPYITGVGGTMGPEDGDEETVCQANKGSLITSGGGFSGYYDQPSFQKAYVDTYFDTVDGTSEEPSGSGYDSSKRGVPDVALMANNYLIVAGDDLVVVSGTSASSPVFAGMVALINSGRIETGKSTLGWLNPLLYSENNTFFNDITSGNNKCLTSGVSCCTQGFYATTGWDPATGLGSVNFADMLLQLANVSTVAPQSSGGNNDDDDNGLSSGVVAAIVICTILGVGVIAAVAYFLLCGSGGAAAGGGSAAATTTSASTAAAGGTSAVPVANPVSSGY